MYNATVIPKSDAIQYGIGAVLLHRFLSIAYFTRSLNSKKRN